MIKRLLIFASIIVGITCQLLYARNIFVLSLDGNGDYLRTPDANSLDLSNSVTLEAWIKPSSTAGPRVIISKWNDNTGEQSYIFKIHNNSDKLRIELKPIGGDLEGTTSIELDVWTHVAITYDSVNVKLYVNGIEDGTQQLEGSINNSLADLLVGAADVKEFFIGLIDEVRIWNIARTQTAIQADMNQLLTGHEAGLVAYYRFDVHIDFQAADVRDVSGNGNHGERVGDAARVSAPDLPLPIELSAFTGTATPNGILLQWQTVSEINNLGFHVYRSTTQDGDYILITPSLIRGQGSDSTPYDYSFFDETAEEGQSYWYLIEDIDFSGITEKSDPIQVVFSRKAVPLKVLPAHFALYQNYPNPFNPETWIPYELAADTEVTITIYSSFGHHIRTLELGTQPANSYLEKDRAAYWDGYSHIGERVSSGIYYYHFQAGEFIATRKMLILK